MDGITIDREAMGRLAKALVFVCGADYPTTVALKTAAESGVDRDIKNARTCSSDWSRATGARRWQCLKVNLAPARAAMAIARTFDVHHAIISRLAR
jgi:hypothetical protein